MGRRLSHKDPDLWPFVILNIKNGEMDFGSGFDQEDRFAELNIFSKKIEVGEYVTYTEKSEESTYRIIKIEKLY